MAITDLPITDISNLIPQKIPFIMVDTLLEFSPKKIVSSYHIPDSNLFIQDNQFLESGLIENMAQTVALHTGYDYFLKGEDAPTGYIGSIKKVEVLRDRYGLTDADEVSRYHEMWWRETIDANFPDLQQDYKEGLLLRWAYGDKKSLNMRSLANEIGKDEAASVKKFDKEDVKKKYKENIRPFEDLFLELGSIILKNASNFVAANPDKEMQRLHNQIRTEAEAIKKTGGEAQIAKVEAELARLDRIGGIESIIPYIKDSGLHLIACTEKTDVDYTEVDYTVPIAIMMGGEESGIAISNIKKSDSTARLPLMGKVQSLNVSVAAGIIMYEAVRQRG